MMDHSDLLLGSPYYGEFGYKFLKVLYPFVAVTLTGDNCVSANDD